MLGLSKCRWKIKTLLGKELKGGPILWPFFFSNETSSWENESLLKTFLWTFHKNLFYLNAILSPSAWLPTFTPARLPHVWPVLSQICLGQYISIYSTQGMGMCLQNAEFRYNTGRTKKKSWFWKRLIIMFLMIDSSNFQELSLTLPDFVTWFCF